jgi:large subunit ribosomal protein L29
MAKNEDMIVAKELRERGDAELQSLLASKREELHGAKFKQALGQLRETHTIKFLRRDIARLQTLLKERELQSKEQQA